MPISYTFQNYVQKSQINDFSKGVELCNIHKARKDFSSEIIQMEVLLVLKQKQIFCDDFHKSVLLML